MKKQILNSLFESMEGKPFQVQYWDGEIKDYGEGNPVVRIIFNSPPSASYDFSDPVLAFGEAYMDDVWDFEGSLDDIMLLMKKNREKFYGSRGKLVQGLGKLTGGPGDKSQQKENISHHYDLGNDFYRLWLDETLSYSCAYFQTPDDTLKQAQLQKIDHALKKLQLKPGEKLLDIGSGWGWLILRAAQQYDVNAVGITLSEEQCRETEKRIKEYGLQDKVEVRLLDYLDMEGSEEQYDKIVSIGMFEHVGKEKLHRYMEKVAELLVEEGVSLLHSIMGPDEGSVNTWITRYIFPGGYIPSLRETVSLLPEYDFHLLHAESLRLHYARTLDHWYSNYRENWDKVEKTMGRKFARMWEIYLLGCASNFRVSGLNIYQLLFTKGLNNQLEMTYDFLYRQE